MSSSLPRACWVGLTSDGGLAGDLLARHYGESVVCNRMEPLEWSRFFVEEEVAAPGELVGL